MFLLGQFPVVSKFIYSILAMVASLYLGTKTTHLDCLSEFIDTLVCEIIVAKIFVTNKDMNFVLIDPDHPFHWRLYYVHVNGFRIRCRYYFIWILADSINNLAGLGFNGYDQHGRARWDLVSNVFAWDVELALNMRDIATRWHALTSNWMRRWVKSGEA